MNGSDGTPRSSVESATVRLQNVGPISEGNFEVKPLTLFTGRNGAGKTITSTLLYILQKCLWSAFRSQLRVMASRLVSIERHSTSKEALQAQTAELNEWVKSPAFQKEIESAFTEELSRAFSSQRNIIRHGKRKAVFQVDHSLGWSFECEINSNSLKCSLVVPPMTLSRNPKESLGTVVIQREISKAFRSALGAWHDRPIMIPAGRAGITDSYRFLAEQVLLERHGYRLGGPSGITRDFLALLVGSSQPTLFDEDEGEIVKFVSSLFDPLLGGQLRPSYDPEELFTFAVGGHKIDRNVMSSMVKELGPMVVLLQQSQARGSVLIVDEPECHLHPRAQIDLARAFVTLVANNSRFVLSTHSPYLAQSLSNSWVESSRSQDVSADAMAVVNFADSSKGVLISNGKFDPAFGFTFDDFADTANAVQDEFVELFD